MCLRISVELDIPVYMQRQLKERWNYKMGRANGQRQGNEIGPDIRVSHRAKRLSDIYVNSEPEFYLAHPDTTPLKVGWNDMRRWVTIRAVSVLYPSYELYCLAEE